MEHGDVARPGVLRPGHDQVAGNPLPRNELAQVEHDATSHEQLRRQPVDGRGPRLQMRRGVDVRPGLRTDPDVQHVVAVAFEGAVPDQRRHRVAGIHLHPRTDGV